MDWYCYHWKVEMISEVVLSWTNFLIIFESIVGFSLDNMFIKTYLLPNSMVSEQTKEIIFVSLSLASRNSSSMSVLSLTIFLSFFNSGLGSTPSKCTQSV